MKTLNDSIFDNLQGKFFKHKSQEGVLVCSINSLGLYSEKKEGSNELIAEDTLLGYSEVLGQQVHIRLFELDNYLEITRQEYSELIKRYKGLEDEAKIMRAHNLKPIHDGNKEPFLTNFPERMTGKGDNP